MSGDRKKPFSFSGTFILLFGDGMDIAIGSPEDRAAAWFRENEAALSIEADYIRSRGVPGSHLTLNHPKPMHEFDVFP
ncbi:hypothetical protein [Rhodovulum adriaticum]|uniref:Uncharacterized protein n=1 Tax=Rhodovulum adriaticum TaxID=35804 RepID=A0A4R2P121_RHOAD|nr:hypothetical protein [Rhodovulum adriaticum]TCP27614.1 hypothetical protein EV656_101523 [Rhodovulum adriaticum]